MGKIKGLKYYKVLLFSSLLLALVAGCVKDEPDAVWSLEAGDKLPEFSVTMNDGRFITTETLRGKESIIVFFNTTCPDCQREFPVLQQEYEQSILDGSNVEYVLISREEGSEAIEEYWKNNGLTLPYSAQTDRTVYNLFATIGIPRLYYVSPDLIITKAILAE